MTVTGDAVGADPVPRRPTTARTLRPSKADWPLWAMTAGMPIAYLLGVQGVVWCLPGAGVRRPDPGRPRRPLPAVEHPADPVPRLDPAVDGHDRLGQRVPAVRLPVAALRRRPHHARLAGQRVATSRCRRCASSTGWPRCGSASSCSGTSACSSRTSSRSRRSRSSSGPSATWASSTRSPAGASPRPSGFLGYPLPRPAAPFNATNGWGAAVGILTPFFIRSWIVQPDRRRRRWGYLIGARRRLPDPRVGEPGPVDQPRRRHGVLRRPQGAARQARRVRGARRRHCSRSACCWWPRPAGQLVGDKLDKSEKSNESRSSLYERGVGGRARFARSSATARPQHVEGADPKMPPDRHPRDALVPDVRARVRGHGPVPHVDRR